jgi:transcriptional regulator with XRE-family HTH domain
MKNWKTLEAFERELLEDDEFREEFEKREPEYRIAREILATRRSVGISQQALAKLIGTSQSRISKWERGEELPRIDNLQRIAEATGSTLHVSLEPAVSSGWTGTSRVTRKTAARKKASGRKTTSGKRIAARKSTGRTRASGRKATSRKAGKRVAARKSTARTRATERKVASPKAVNRRSSRS